MHHPLSDILVYHQEEFHPVVPFLPGKTRIGKIDMTSANTSLTQAIMGNIHSFTEYFDQLRKEQDLTYMVGGYAEHRTVYANSPVFDAQPDSSPRRFHLGLDIWGEAGTKVMAPLEGWVHSFANNDEPGDYGGTIILSHELDGIRFYTLYGHLSHASTASIEKRRIQKGEAFAEFGIPAENGNWPPHVHFQLIEAIEDWKGDYPGVCAVEEKEKWLANSPDPDLIVDMIRYCG